MPYFCMFEDTGHTVTRVEVRSVQPEPVIEPPGWIPRYVAEVNGEALFGARIVMDRMDVQFERARHSGGVYAISYPAAREWLAHQLQTAPSSPPQASTIAAINWSDRLRPWLRIAAGLAAVALFAAYVLVNVWMTFVWFAYITLTHRQRSPIRAMAETGILFWILDWRRPIQKLARIALDRE